MDRFESRLEACAVDKISGSFGEAQMHFTAGATKSVQVRLERSLVLL